VSAMSDSGWVREKAGRWRAHGIGRASGGRGMAKHGDDDLGGRRRTRLLLQAAAVAPSEARAVAATTG
jgi:hypothetical protein